MAAKRADSNIGIGGGVTTGAGVGVGVTGGVGVTAGVDVGFGVIAGNGVVLREKAYERPLESNNPGNQNLQRSEVPSDTSPAVHG